MTEGPIPDTPPELTPHERALADELVPQRRPAVSRRQWIWRLVLVGVAGVGIVVMWPRLVELYGQLPELLTLQPEWFVAMLAAQAASIAVMVVLAAESVRSRAWAVITMSQLAANGLGRILPGGAGGALQYQMLTRGGLTRGSTVTGLAAMNLLLTAVPFALPVLALPVILTGAAVNPGLTQTAVIGAVGFAILFAGALVVVVTDRPIRAVASLAERVHNRARPRHALSGMADKWIEERDLLVHAMGSRWWVAVGTAVGAAFLEFLALMAALIAVDAHPQASLVLLAYASSKVLALIPITPGGLGFVEAGLLGTLVLAGVPREQAALASLAYRLVSYWLYLPLGLGAFLLFRSRYGGPATATAPPTG